MWSTILERFVLLYTCSLLLSQDKTYNILFFTLNNRTKFRLLFNNKKKKPQTINTFETKPIQVNEVSKVLSNEPKNIPFKI